MDHALGVTGTGAAAPLGDRLVADHGGTSFLAVFGGGWLTAPAAMHAARWHVRL